MRAIKLPAGAVKLSDNQKWINRFQVVSDSSGNKYIIAQNRSQRFWGCTCSRWATKRECKHLSALGLPAREMPYEIDMVIEQQLAVDYDEMETISPFAPSVPLSEDPEVTRLLNRVQQRTAALLKKEKQSPGTKKPARRFSLDEDV